MADSDNKRRYLSSNDESEESEDLSSDEDESSLDKIRSEMVRYLMNTVPDLQRRKANQIIDILFQSIEHSVNPQTIIHTLIFSIVNDNLRGLERLTNESSQDFIREFILCCMKYYPTNWYFSDKIVVPSIAVIYSEELSCRYSGRFSDNSFKYILNVSIASDSKKNLYYSIEVRLREVRLETIEIDGTLYRLGDKIGSGSYGIVYTATNSSGRKVAIKFGLSDDVSNDLAFCRICSGPGVIPVIGSCSIEPITAIVMPFHPRTLSTYMYENHKLSFEKRIELLSKLLLIIQRLDRLGVFHCDIKSANVLVDETDPNDLQLLVIDGGIFFKYEDGKDRKDCLGPKDEKVTRWYKSPKDAVLSYTMGKNLTRMTDWWAGVVCGLEMLNNGKVPNWLALDSLKKMNEFFKSVLDGQESMEALLLPYFETFYLESESSRLVERMYDFFKRFLNVHKALSSSPYTIDDLVKEMTSILMECSVEDSRAVSLEGSHACEGDRACAFGGDRACAFGGGRACAFGSGCAGSLGDSRAGSLEGGRACAFGDSHVCAPELQIKDLKKCIICNIDVLTHVLMPDKNSIICKKCAEDQTNIISSIKKIYLFCMKHAETVISISS